MTSPDNRPLSAYQRTQGQPVGGWDMDIDLDLLGDLFATADKIFKILTGAAAGLSPNWNTVATLMGIRWDEIDSQGVALAALQDKTQKLEGVIGFAQRYMSASPGVTTTATTMPFDAQVGPAVGVTLQSGGRYRFDSKGLWRMEAQVRFWGAALAPPQVFMDIVVRNPAGTEFARRKAMASTDDEVTVTNVAPVVIPSAGYTAEVQAWTSAIPIIGGNWRGISGGASTTAFSVFKISGETS